FTSDRSKPKVGMLVAVESSSSGSTAELTYGHVGIYIGDGKVMDNIGRIRVTTLDNWFSFDFSFFISTLCLFTFAIKSLIVMLFF
ncbi:hypothetical protein V2P75_26150, partial [Bordetella bronchiseptica]